MNKIYKFCVAGLLGGSMLFGACSKENDEKNLQPYFFDTDLLFEDLDIGRFKHQIPTSPMKFGPATFDVSGSGENWTGFAISNRNFRDHVSTADALDSTRFSAWTGTMPHAGGNFLVVKPGPEGARVTFDRPLTVDRMLITPTTYLYQAIMYGAQRTVSGVIKYTWAPGARILSVARRDYVRIKISGYNGSTHTGDVYHYIADRNSVEGGRNFTVTDWLPVDCLPLGKVTSLVFQIQSSEIEAGTGNIPRFFCIDGIRFTESVKN
jgi:hypothetical protein